MPTAAQVMAQPQVFPLNPERSISTGRPSDKVFSDDGSSRPHETALDDDNEDSLK